MIRQTLFSGWHFMRWLRLGLGVFMAIIAIQTHDTLLGFFSAFFLFQAVANIGCNGTGSCSVPVTKNKSGEIEEVEFEEIKTK